MLLQRKERQLTEGKHSGTMVALFLPSEVARQIAVKDGLPASEMHVTIGYFGKELTDEQKQRLVEIVREFSQDLKPFTALLGGVGRFSASKTSEGKDVVYLSVDSPDITEFRPKLISKIHASGIKASTDHGFTPHVTLAYIDKDAKMPIERIEPIPVKFDTITVAMGDRRVTINLGSKQEHRNHFLGLISEAVGPAKPLTVGTMPTPMLRSPVVGGAQVIKKHYKPRKKVSLLTKPTSAKDIF